MDTFPSVATKWLGSTTQRCVLDIGNDSGVTQISVPKLTMKPGVVEVLVSVDMLSVRGARIEDVICSHQYLSLPGSI